MRRSDREITDRQEILAVLDRAHVCRLAMQDEDGLYIVPMNFGYEWPENGDLTLYFHCAADGRRVRALRSCPLVAFEMDQELAQIPAQTPCGYGCLYESMIGSGQASFLESDAEKQHALAVLMHHQTGKDFSFSPAMTKSVTVFQVTASCFTVKARRK
ncbi:MAG: pyridoxamine 5'-phosphate oxidase family protein [Lachnospiraceae bacterium]|jgi:nitroimidazol reductase NimA-like FMN-containing flavoprotein (pyridoxamine 5'-phosphate oxidase superfamily)|nr:pyridoxamine 5'-phosphate oxidase family protein [Lachnospiraceae bacterium]